MTWAILSPGVQGGGRLSRHAAGTAAYSSRNLRISAFTLVLASMNSGTRPHERIGVHPQSDVGLARDPRQSHSSSMCVDPYRSVAAGLLAGLLPNRAPPLLASPHDQPL